LAARYAADPDGVSRYQARLANLDRVRKRERERFERLVLTRGEPHPIPPVFKRPAGMDRLAWKAERLRIQRAYDDAVVAWRNRQRRESPSAPTAEQASKATFVETDVNDLAGGGRVVKIGRAFCRQPRFETFDWLSPAQVAALRRYRRAFDVSEMSPTKSGLDIGAGGGTGGSEAAISRVQALAFADIAVQRMQEVVPVALLPVLRAVALLDADFKAVALDRFGSASGQRRTRIRRDFTAAVDALVAGRARPSPPPQAANADSIDQPEVPSIDPAFVDEHGHMLPLDRIVDVILGRFAQAEDEAA
jgi:hypothetical protein